jgi:hypothetical protein
MVIIFGGESSFGSDDSQEVGRERRGKGSRRGNMLSITRDVENNDFFVFADCL